MAKSIEPSHRTRAIVDRCVMEFSFLTTTHGFRVRLPSSIHANPLRDLPLVRFVGRRSWLGVSLTDRDRQIQFRVARKWRRSIDLGFIYESYFKRSLYVPCETSERDSRSDELAPICNAATLLRAHSNDFSAGRYVFFEPGWTLMKNR